MKEQKAMEKQGNSTRWRLLWILIVAVWLFVILKVLVGNLFEKNTSLVSAFSKTNPEKMSAIVEVTAQYDGEVVEEEILTKIAERIQLDITEEFSQLQTKQRQEVYYEKQAKMANTELRLIRICMEDGEEKQYIYAKIHLKEEVGAVITYKTILEEVMKELNGTEISTTIQFVGEHLGYLTLERRNKVTNQMLDMLGANVVYEHREDDLYTVYAYTASLDNYITVDNKKINVHVAMAQDEENYRTILYLASPILPDTW